jgi:hypothetical protein
LQALNDLDLALRKESSASGEIVTGAIGLVRGV